MLTRASIAFVLASFLALTARALAAYGYVGFFEQAFANAVVSVLAFDLVICLSLIAVFIYHDARKLGITPWPYIAIGATLGAAGPLLYLLRRLSRKEPFVNVPRISPQILLPVLIGFSAATAFAIYHHGYVAFVTYALANEATQLLFVDLALNLILVAVWLFRDARARGARYVPYLALALFFGSVGPLLYLVRRRPGRESLQIA
jgi:Terpene cyclase DEP1